MHDGTGSVISMNANDVQGYINDLTVENITASNTIGVGITLGAPAGQPLAADVSNVIVHDAFIYGGVGVTFTTPKPTVPRSGNPYDITLENIEVDGSPNNSLNPSSVPIGIDFHRHVPQAGDDRMLLQNVTASGFATQLLIEPGFDGMLLDNVHWTGNAVIESPVTEVNSGPN
jgi:hypothetical protein